MTLYWVLVWLQDGRAHRGQREFEGDISQPTEYFTMLAGQHYTNIMRLQAINNVACDTKGNGAQKTLIIL